MNQQLDFLSGGGEMGMLIREKDWSNTSIGKPGDWPQSLRTTISIILNSRFPMFLFWGPELICFYNDAYRPSLGNDGKHPAMLGGKAEEHWKEIWPAIKPLIDQVLAGGEASWSEDQLLPIYRNGKLEHVYWTFSYSAVKDESGKPAGIFVTCYETTEKVNTTKSLTESELRFRLLADNIPNLAWMADAKGYIYWYNKQWYDYTGTTADQMKGWGWQSVHHPEVLPEVVAKWKASIKNGNEFEMVFPIRGADGSFRSFLTRVVPSRNDNGEVYQWFGTNTDITTQKEIEDALKESKDELEFAIDAGQFGTYDYNPLTDKFTANERLRNWFGLPPEEQIELWHATNVIPEDEREAVTKAILKSLDYASGGKYDIVYNIVHPVTNKIIHVHAKGKASFNEDNIAYRLNGTLEDITEQAAAAKKLKESVDRYYSLIHSSPSAIGILYGEDLVITIANNAIIEIWGKGKDIIGKAYFDALPELAEQGYREIFANVYTTGIPFNAVETPVHILQEGEMKLKYYNFLLFPQRNINDEIDGIGIIATDVTFQALLNKKIKDSEQRFVAAVQAVQGIVWTNNSKGEMEGEQPGWASLTGQAYEEYQNYGWANAVHPDDAQASINAWNEAVEQVKIFDIEHRVKIKEGSYRSFSVKAIPLINDEGILHQWVGVHTDIQNLKEQEQQKDYFISMASHELKTPITSLKGYLQLLQGMYKEKEDVFLQDSLNVMNKQVARLVKLITELLDVSKIKIGGLEFNKEHFDLKVLIMEVAEEIKLINADYEVIVSIQQEVSVYADRHRIGQVLINFLTNAVKYSPKSKIIRINSYVENNYVVVSVEDFGIGITKENQARIFERFYRVAGKDEKTYPGFGIGLFIASEIIERHKGKIHVESEPGKGSLFSFSLLVNG